MRSYPRNSPEAAARIVALMLTSDGNVCRSEVETPVVAVARSQWRLDDGAAQAGPVAPVLQPA